MRGKSPALCEESGEAEELPTRSGPKRAMDEKNTICGMKAIRND